MIVCFAESVRVLEVRDRTPRLAMPSTARASTATVAAVLTLATCVLVARAETTLSSFGQTGPYATTRTATVAVPRVSSSREAGELFIQYPAGAVIECPLIVFMFPIHGFPFTTWRGLLSTVISTLVSNGFAVATPVAVDPDGARPIRGGMFPGTAVTASGIDLREMVTRYLNFMTHASTYLIERVESDPGFALRDAVSVQRMGCAGFSVGGALSQYLAQRLSDRVAMEVAFAPTIGSEEPFTATDDIGAELFREYAASAVVPTIFVVGEDDDMGGLRDSGLYYTQSRAPKLQVIAGNGATHCHAIVPMSQCENGSRGAQRLDAVMAHAAATLYLRPDTPEWRLRKEFARDIIWGDGLRDIERERGDVRGPLAQATTWSVAAVKRAPAVTLEMTRSVIVAPLAPRSVTVVARVRSTHALTSACGDVEVVVARAPAELDASATRIDADAFEVTVRWRTVPSRERAREREALERRALFERVSRFFRDLLASRGTFVPAPASATVTLQARHACPEAGYAFAHLVVEQPYA